MNTHHHDRKFRARRILGLALGVALAAWAVTPTAHAGTRDLKIRWQLSPDSDVSKYRIHRGTQTGQYDTVVEITSFDLESAGRASTTLRGLDDSVTYYFAISAVDAAGQPSAPSNELSIAGVEPVPAGPDSDGDGLSDAQEAALGTLPGQRDTDSDGTDDGDEVRLGRNPRVDEIKVLLLLFQD